MAVVWYLFDDVDITSYLFIDSFQASLIYKITYASHILAAFRPVHQSCTSSTLLLHTAKIVSSYATLSATFIIKQALIVEERVMKQPGSVSVLLTHFGGSLLERIQRCSCEKRRMPRR